MHIPFHGYQLEAVEHGIKYKQSMLFGSIGSGKTPVALEMIKRLIYGLSIRKALIIAPPKVVTSTYPGELKKWDDFKYLSYEVLHGPKKLERLQNDVDLYIVSYNSIEWVFKNSPYHFDYVILDESHCVKSAQSKRFKNLEKYLDYTTYRTTMTGSPIGNSIRDLWSQYYLLDGGVRLFPTEDTFLNYWFTLPYEGRVWKPKRGARIEITKRIADITYEIPASKVALPALEENTVFIKLPARLREMYDELEQESILEFNNTDVTAFNIGTLLQKLRQFSCGFLYTDEETEQLHELKIKTLKKRLDEAGNRVMVVANFKEEFYMLKRHFPEMRRIFGDTSDKKAVQAIDLWNDGKLDLLAVHPKSAGTGLNLQGGGYRQIWLSPDWSLLDRNQTIGRLYRQGQKSDRVIIDNLIIEGTIEERIMSAIDQKIDTVAGFIKELRIVWGIA